MRFSIVIPTFNRTEFLGQAIESALAQTYANREIVVVDDGSAEDTQNLVSRYGSAISFVRQHNQGKSVAMNTGIAATSGDVIIVLDDDDIFPPWTIAKHAEALVGAPTADFSYGRFVRFKGRQPPHQSELLDEEFVPVRDPRRLVIKLMENCFLPNPAWALRRDAQLRAGPYDPRLRYSHDYEMVLRCARKNEGVFVDEHVLYQRKHSSARGPLSERVYLVDTVEKWVKYDSMIFKEIARDWDVNDFRPFLNSTHPVEVSSSALLQKGIVLFQRKVYDEAMGALDQYRRMLGGRRPNKTELRIAAGLLGCRYGVTDLLVTASRRVEVIAALRAQDWPIMMRSAFACQVRWRVRNSLAAGDLGCARELIQFSREAFGTIATGAVLFTWYKAGLGAWQESKAIKVVLSNQADLLVLTVLCAGII
jgi:glycosyltransferase involved in cell wall biosynthesis